MSIKIPFMWAKNSKILGHFYRDFSVNYPQNSNFWPNEKQQNSKVKGVIC